MGDDLDILGASDTIADSGVIKVSLIGWCMAVIGLVVKAAASVECAPSSNRPRNQI